jgi:tRNA uridine 5-carbamoylmethylation protein Kti12
VHHSYLKRDDILACRPKTVSVNTPQGSIMIRELDADRGETWDNVMRELLETKDGPRRNHRLDSILFCLSVVDHENGELMFDWKKDLDTVAGNAEKGIVGIDAAVIEAVCKKADELNLLTPAAKKAAEKNCETPGTCGSGSSSAVDGESPSANSGDG